jgi:hypothetical protein
VAAKGRPNLANHHLPPKFNAGTVGAEAALTIAIGHL